MAINSFFPISGLRQTCSLFTLTIVVCKWKFSGRRFCHVGNYSDNVQTYLVLGRNWYRVRLAHKYLHVFVLCNVENSTNDFSRRKTFFTSRARNQTIKLVNGSDKDDCYVVHFLKYIKMKICNRVPWESWLQDGLTVMVS